MATRLPDVDQPAVDAYWAACCTELGLTGSTPVAEFFGDSVEMAQDLADLVIDGPKRATAGAVADFDVEGEPLPEVDGWWIVLDGRGRPACLLQTSDVRIGPLSSVDDAFAHDEGEGDRTRADWLDAHRRFFARHLPTIGVAFNDEIPVVFERFALRHVAGRGPVPEPQASRGSDADVPRSTP